MTLATEIENAAGEETILGASTSDLTWIESDQEAPSWADLSYQSPDWLDVLRAPLDVEVTGTPREDEEVLRVATPTRVLVIAALADGSLAIYTVYGVPENIE